MSDRDVGQSGSSSGARAATVSDIHELMRRKEEIEAQIKANYEVLEGQKGVGMNEPLVDFEGYPRADVDVYQVRTARHNIICLQNDHKAVMKQVEEALHQLHAHDKEKQARDLAEAHEEAMSRRMSHNEGHSLSQAFAKVNSISPGSPASIAVIQPSPKSIPREEHCGWVVMGSGRAGCEDPTLSLCAAALTSFTLQQALVKVYCV
ncbi:Hypothetical predicted protein [Marmota monax]|uniref:Nas2 N-terminal domain-containing protein n=1 Tax=Marmota monax TaxID=9995 RepID=A0A5E4AQW4_MARMO|nr:hypothetical protein GHT09_004416 [Marmota monax]VTJ59883.1 Hypothetical predicted protein [Marmota monax]